MASPAEKNQKFTYGDYLEWLDGERWELIDGEAFNITPTPSRTHQEILLALADIFTIIWKTNPVKCMWPRLMSGFRRPINPRRISPRWFSPT